MQLHQIGWIGSIRVLLPVLSWCYFNSVSQKRSFMWDTSGGWSEGWTEHEKLANDMMIRMEGDVYQEQSLSKGWPEWTDGEGGRDTSSSGFLETETRVVEPCCPLLASAKNKVSVNWPDVIWHCFPSIRFHAKFIKQIKHVISKYEHCNTMVWLSNDK